MADHTLSDHALGALFGHHRHDEGEHDHDHDHDEAFAEAEEGGARLLVSLGLDIGSSSTQAVLSRLAPQAGGRFGAAEVFYASPVMATPFTAGGAIDLDALWRLLERVFRDSGVGPDGIDTGAVILTGAAAERRNAAAISHQVSHAVGDLVCAAAGDHMEARLAAYGSGAVEASRTGGGRRLLLVDVGGATAKLALVENGDVLSTAVLGVGGRLLVLDRQDRIVRLEPWGVHHLAAAGLDAAVGAAFPPDGRAVVAELMAERVAEAVRAAVEGEPWPAAAAELLLTGPLASPGGVQGVMVSGGVGEYVYGRERRDFGDLGRPLGTALRRRLDNVGAPLLEPAERIRATALGASRYSVQMSGDTLYVSSHARLLPRRNLPVARPRLDLSGEIEPDAVAEAVRASLSEAPGGESLVLALPWRGEPSYPRLRALAEGLAGGSKEQIAQGQPLYVVTEGDIAATLGAILKEDLQLPVEVMVVDGVRLDAFDYLDLGRIRLPSRTVPVTVKSLLFGAATSA